MFAQLIVNGKNYGVKPFIVQLRDKKTFDPLPGISIGDCGPKMGRNGIDNGWIQFTFVRIPRSHLLMKYTKVSREGKVTEPPIAQLSYGALIQGRVSMIRESADISKKALTIAARYSCIRKQFSSNPGGQETQIINYLTHQNRLFPVLVSAMAMHFGAVEMYRIYDDLMAKLESTSPGDKSMSDAVESLKETHATSAGLKAYCTWYAIEAIEQCRQCCGGHGYSSYAGFSSMYNDYAVQCSWEGDNTVLSLQTGRYLLMCYKNVKEGKIVAKGVRYLKDSINRPRKLESEEVFTLDSMSEAFDLVRCQTVISLGCKFESLRQQENMSEDKAYERCCMFRYVANIVY